MSTRQPFKDINKFGLLHYSIPKTCDTLGRMNRKFTLEITYEDGYVFDVPVEMPDLDYYNMLVSQQFDHSTTGLNLAGRNKQLLAFDEVLQTTLNWAIMKEYDSVIAAGPAGNDGGYSFAELMLCRVSCIVQRNDAGRLEIYCGYRGSQTVQNINDETRQAYNAGFANNSGRLDQHYNCVTPGGHNTSNPVVQYTIRTGAGVAPLQVPSNNPYQGVAAYNVGA